MGIQSYNVNDGHGHKGSEVPTILYVDDQVNQLTLFKRAFEGQYHVMTADAPEKGLEILSHHKIFLVIADHNMPQMTGVDFLEKAKTLSPQSVQAIVSAYLSEKIVKESEARTNVSEHLTKPWKMDVVRDFIDEAWREITEKEPIVEVPTVPAKTRTDLSLKVATKLVHFLQQEWVDARGAKRVFLTYSEPRLRDYVAKVCRPFPALIQRAQEHAIHGDLKSAEKSICEFLKQNTLYTGF